MSLWSWRTMPDGSVEVNRGDGFGFVRPTLYDHAGLGAHLGRVLSWLPLVSAASRKHGVPESWILAVIHAESGGKADAENWCCVGLMAIYAKLHGLTREELKDPEVNIDYGTSLLAHAANEGCDLPVAASHHVAGPAKAGGCATKSGTCCSAVCRPDCDPDKCVTHPEHPEGSPWGMCEHMFPKTWGDGAVGYIDRVVRANNTYVDLLRDARLPPGEEIPVVPAGGGKTLAIFAIGAGLGYLSVDHLSRLVRRYTV